VGFAVAERLDLLVPLVIAVALMAMGAHWALADFPTGLMSALAVLLIACPCALAIATPLAVWSAMGRAAAEGVIFRGDDSINRLAAASVICFDKTGTLSTGTAHVDELRCAEGQDREDVLRRAAALAESSIHPLSAAIDDYARGALHAATATPALGHVRPHAGLGIEGRDSATGRLLLLGSERFLTQRGIRIPPELARAASDASARGGSVTLLAADGRACGLFVLREQLRPETASVVSRLKSRGLQIRVLTGDRPERATQLAGQLSLPVEAQLLPHDKLDFVRSLQRQGEHVVMVGDGVNDAPALAAADVGVAMGCGADVTRDAAGVCLLSSDLERLPWALGLAQRTRRTVRRNLTWAFGYNSVGVALAACGLLNPVLAAALMFFSSLLVVSSSLRLAGETASGEEGGAGADSGESSRPQSSPGSRIEQRDPEPLAVGGTP